MRPPRMQLLCDPNPMCFGATGALLSVLDHVDAERVAMGTGVSAELLRHDPAVDEWVDIDVKDTHAVDRLLQSRHFDVALVVSNTANLELYRDHGIPAFFVDVLYWLGANKGRERSRLLEAEFALAFPGVVARVADFENESEVRVIGPLVRSGPPVPAADARGTLAHFGGGASRWVQPGVNSRYASMAASWLRAAGTLLPRPMHLALGAAAATDARWEEAGDGLTLGPLAQPVFIQKLRASELYVTTPGTGGVFDGLLGGVPTLFLPPQNATQVLQLITYEAEDLVAPGLNLTELDPSFVGQPKDLSEKELTEQVLQSLARLDGNEVTAAVVDHLRRQIEELPTRAAARREFMAALGPPGAPTVAAALNQFWRER